METNTMQLPSGWKKEEHNRPNGLSSGQSIVFYISPKGVKVTNPKQMQSLLGNKFDISTFDWRTGKFIKKVENAPEYCSYSKNRFSPYMRASQIPMDLKPKIISNCSKSKRTDNKVSNVLPPQQLFWEKRFNDIIPVDSGTGESVSSLKLPKCIQSAGVIGIDRQQVMLSLISAVSSKNMPIYGQEQLQSDIEKNPCVAINHSQPLIKPYLVTDDDLKKQEAKVKELRKKLQAARSNRSLVCV